jgi:hypothetical protein
MRGGINYAYPKIYNGKALGNLILGRARRIYIMGKGEVHRDFLESSTFIWSLLIESSEYTGTAFLNV